MSNKDKDKVTKQFQLNTQDEAQRHINDFIKICPKQLSALCVIALSELIETYHLENASAADVKNFINFYHFYKARMDKETSMAMTNFVHLFSNTTLPNIAPVTTDNPEVEADIETEEEMEEESYESKTSLVSESDKEMMKSIMSNM